MVISFSFVACTTDDGLFGDNDEFSFNEKNNDPTPSDSTSTPTPSSKDSVDWNSGILARSFQYDNGRWPSRLTFGILGQDKDTVFTANLPMMTIIEAPAEIIVDSNAPATCFSSLDPAIELDSTEWRMDEADGFYYRTITRKQVIHMNNYDCTIISIHTEAYMFKNGKEYHFLNGQESAPTRWNDTPKAAGEDVQRDGKTYTVENAFIMMQHKLHVTRTEYPEATTKVLREKKEEKKDETMPTPDLKVSAYGNVNNITFSPEFQGNNVVWHKICLTRNYINGKEYFSIWVDGSFVRTVELKSNEQNQKYNSAYLVDGVWVPAILRYSSSNDGGWDYTFVVSGEAKMKTVDQRMAVTSGLSNFKKDNDASQTPSIYTTTSVKEYGTKKLVTVNGYDKDMKPVIEFTIGECL